KAKKDELKQQLAEARMAHPQSDRKLESVNREIGDTAREQEKYMVQKRQFEEQLRGEGPNPVDENDEEEKMMLKEMIAELVEKESELDTRVKTLMAEEEKARMLSAGIGKRIETVGDQIEKTEENIEVLKASQEVDPGIAVLKVSGTLFNKTEIIGPHKKMTIPRNMQSVRIAETKVDPDSNRYQMAISSLR
ncbi:MAG: hypothetical protein PVH22_01280, partial [Desulfobacteraceae bacterium]